MNVTCSCRVPFFSGMAHIRIFSSNDPLKKYRSFNGWKSTAVTKSTCGNTHKQLFRRTCHKRTVLSIDDDNKKWFCSVRQSIVQGQRCLGPCNIQDICSVTSEYTISLLFKQPFFTYTAHRVIWCFCCCICTSHSPHTDNSILSGTNMWVALSIPIHT